MSGPDSSLIVRKAEGVIIVEFSDARILDQVQIERIKDYLLKLVHAAGHPKMIISFHGVSSISSAVIGVIIAVNKSCKEKEGELRLASLSSDIITVFKLTKLDKIIKIYGNVEQAQLKF